MVYHLAQMLNGLEPTGVPVGCTLFSAKYYLVCNLHY